MVAAIVGFAAVWFDNYDTVEPDAAEASGGAKERSAGGGLSHDQAHGEEPATFGPEALAGKIALAAYERDLKTLRRYTSKGLKEHYGDPEVFDRNVAASLEAAPEIPQISPDDPRGGAGGKAEVVGAAPVNLFGQTVFYTVTVRALGEEHLLGVALKEAPDNAPEETVYCYLFVDNEKPDKLGEPGEKEAEREAWPALVGVEDTCFQDNRGPEDSDKPVPETPMPEKPAPDNLVRWEELATPQLVQTNPSPIQRTTSEVETQHKDVQIGAITHNKAQNKIKNPTNSLKHTILV